MIGAFGVLADEGVEFVVGLDRRARLDFLAPIGVECGLAENLARDADAVAEIDPVLRVGHVAEADARRRRWGRRCAA